VEVNKNLMPIDDPNCTNASDKSNRIAKPFLRGGDGMISAPTTCAVQSTPLIQK
jgi:hypothetical protein